MTLDKKQMSEQKLKEFMETNYTSTSPVKPRPIPKVQRVSSKQQGAIRRNSNG